MKRTIAALAVLALIAGACTSSETAATTTTSATTTTAPPASTTTTTTSSTSTTQPPSGFIPAGMTLDRFGSFPEIPLLGDEPAYAGPATPQSLDGVTVYPAIAAELADPDLRAMLERNGFAVVPADFRLFWHVYGMNEYDPHPVYVTTDVAYHLWHLVFDKTLRDIEEQQLLPILERLVLGLVAAARNQRDEYVGTPLADAADRAAQFYEAAATLLELDVGPIGELARQEVALAMEHTVTQASPTIGVHDCSPGFTASCVFYELFKPRGHYTRSPALERFFRAMSLLGQGPFPLDPESLTIGIMAMRPLLADADLVTDWRLIYEPTAFLVGAADDYTPFELATAAADVTPEGLNAPLELTDPKALEDLADGLRRLRPVEINPETASARVMGVRFTLDAYVLDQLLRRMPDPDNRIVASVRDIAAAFGSAWAYDSLADDGYTAREGYDAKLEEMRALVAARTVADWTRTVYDAWLYAIAAVWAPHGEAFPDYMRTAAWTAKAHQTGFGSYAELKHDTILYTKQAIAEGGDGGEPPPPPRHWVEPDPVAFERLQALTGMLRDGLDARGLLDDQHAEVIAYLEDQLAFLARIARAELNGEPISEEDNRSLGWFGGAIENLWLNTSDMDTLGEEGGPDEDAAIVADILRSGTEGALEVATGKIDLIYVIVPDDAGGFEVAKGGVYSFYEFWQDPSDRLTDEQWRAMLEAGEAPERPAWQEVFLVR